MTTITRWVLQHRLIVAIAWSAIALIGLAGSGAATRALSQQFTVSGGYEGIDTNSAILHVYGTGGDAAPLVPVIVLWVGFDTLAKTVVLFFFAFFPMVINTYQGVKNVDPKLLEVGNAFRCTERQLWANIVLPGSLPFIITGLRLAIGRGLIGMVLADLYTAISGIGYLIVRSASSYRVDKMFVPVVVLGLLGVTLTALVRLLERYVAPWTAAGSGD